MLLHGRQDRHHPYGTGSLPPAQTTVCRKKISGSACKKMVNGRIIGMAGPPGDPADGWEENQTLVGGVLFFLCPLLQIPSYCFSCPMQEKSVPFFTARCMSYCFYGEIFICGDCAVATPFKMPSNSRWRSPRCFPASGWYPSPYRPGQRIEADRAGWIFCL